MSVRSFFECGMFLKRTYSSKLDSPAAPPGQAKKVKSPIAGVPLSQALPGYLITAPSSVCVPDVLGALAVWIKTKKRI